MADEPKKTDEPVADGRSKAGKRIAQITAEREELRAENSQLKERVTALEATVAAMGADQSLNSNQIQRRVIAGIANEMARRDVHAKLARHNAFAKKVAAELGLDFVPSPEVDKVALPNHLVAILQSHEHGPKVAAHLIKHPEKAQEILSHPPHEHAARLGQLITVLTTKPREHVVTKAGKPIDSVGTGRTGVQAKDPGSMSMKEYKEWRANGGGR